MRTYRTSSRGRWPLHEIHTDLAAKRGLRDQTYLKMLLHGALGNEEKRLAS
jgi:hypothetical protein